MVNGRPPLVLGGGSGMASLQPSGGLSARNGLKRQLAAVEPEFASVLSGANRAAKPAAPAMPVADRGSAPPLMSSFSMQGVNADLTAALRKNPGVTEGAAPARNAGNGKSGRAHLPAGQQSRTEASAQAFNAMQPQAMRSQAQAASASKLAAQQAGAQRSGGPQPPEGLPRGAGPQGSPRVAAGSPVTGRGLPVMEGASQDGAARPSGRYTAGRYSFGMEDTRRNTAGASRAAGSARQEAAPSGAQPRRAYDATSQEVYGALAPANMAALQGYGLGYATSGGGEGITATQMSGMPVSNEQIAALRALPGGMTFGAARSVQFPSGQDAGVMAVRTASHKRGVTAASHEYMANNFNMIRGFQPAETPASMCVGALAAKFESGSEGIAAIGYDRHGGTSYGKFQLSSRAGTMSKFIRYLEDAAPDLAKKLAAAGPTNTGRRAGKMPEVWRGIAAAEPERFENLQNDFIRKSHFEPALQSIAEKTGIDFQAMPVALQEVVFSTAVQHGPNGASRIISRAADRVGVSKLQQAQLSAEGLKTAGQDLIRQIYSIRKGQFVSSTEQVQAAAKSRLNNEMNEALSMLA